jgi:hypothetical protein
VLNAIQNHITLERLARNKMPLFVDIVEINSLNHLQVCKLLSRTSVEKVTALISCKVLVINFISVVIHVMELQERRNACLAWSQNA